MEQEKFEKLMVVLKEQRELQQKTYKWINFWSILNICLLILGILIFLTNYQKILD